MATISQIISGSITKSSLSVTQAGFGTPLILAYGAPAALTDSYYVYSSLAAMVTASWQTDHPAYMKAAKIFGQNPKVTEIVVGIGSNDPTRILELVPIVQNDHDYTITINGTEFEITSDATATQKEIVDAMTVEIEAGSEPVTATDDDLTLTLTSDVAGDWFSALMVDGDWSTIVDDTADVDTSADMTAIKAAADNGNQDFYVIIPTYQSDAILTVLNTWVSSEAILLAFDTTGAGAIASPTSGITATLSAASSTRSIPFYHEDEPVGLAHGESHLAAGSVGKLLPYDAGKATWMFKTVSGVLPNVLTDTEKSRLASDNVNWYETVAGVSMINGGTLAAGGGGTVASGEYIDIVQGMDWLLARTGEALFAKLAAVLKVPFTEDGKSQLEQAIGGVMELAVEKTILVDGSYLITIPDADDVSAADKENRLWSDIVITGTLQGAVHRVPFAITVSL